MTIGLPSIRGLAAVEREREREREARDGLIYKCLRGIPNSQLGHRIENIQLRRAPTVDRDDGRGARTDGRKEGRRAKD